ncbi:hypothetical protein YC2023_080072 [Brassica napus]
MNVTFREENKYLREGGAYDSTQHFIEVFMNSFSSEAFLGTCRKLQSLIEHMVSELDTRTEAEVVSTVQNVTL